MVKYTCQKNEIVVALFYELLMSMVEVLDYGIILNIIDDNQLATLNTFLRNFCQEVMEVAGMKMLYNKLLS